MWVAYANNRKMSLISAKGCEKHDFICLDKSSGTVSRLVKNLSVKPILHPLVHLSISSVDVLVRLGGQVCTVDQRLWYGLWLKLVQQGQVSLSQAAII